MNKRNKKLGTKYLNCTWKIIIKKKNKARGKEIANKLKKITSSFLNLKLNKNNKVNNIAREKIIKLSFFKIKFI